MTLHQLRVFVALAENRTVTQVARTFHVSQSGVSHQLKRLQDALGTVLLVRTARGIALTEVGAAFKADAESMLAQLDGLRGKYSGGSRTPDEIVTIGANYGATATFLPGLIAKFRENHPGAKLNLYTDTSRGIEALLTDDKIDIGITTSRKRFASFTMEPFQTVRLCAFVAANHPLGKGKNRLCPRARGAWPIAILGKEERLRTGVLLKRLSEIGANASTLIRCGSPDAVKTAAINNRGIGILHSDVVQSEVKRREIVPLNVSTNDLTSRTYIIYSKKKRLSAPAQDLLEMLRRTRSIRATLASTAQT